MTAGRDSGFVVVTGTSTGIGAATAAHLTKRGFHVFAGVRQKADGEALRAQAPDWMKMPPPNLKPDYEEQARGFVDGLVDTVLERRPAAVAQS